MINKVSLYSGIANSCCCHANAISSSALWVLAATQIGRLNCAKLTSIIFSLAIFGCVMSVINESWVLISVILGVLITHFSEPAT